MSKPPTTKKKTFGSNLNTLTKAPVAVQSTSRYGSSRLLSLGKVGQAKGLKSGGPAAPIPLNTPSLRKESGGQDTTVQLVPATPGWGKEVAPDTEVSEPDQPSQQQPQAKKAPWSSSGTLKSSWAAGASAEPESSGGTSPILGPSLGGTKNMKWGDLDSDDEEEEEKEEGGEAGWNGVPTTGGFGDLEQRVMQGPPMTRDQAVSNQYRDSHHPTYRPYFNHNVENGEAGRPESRDLWRRKNETEDPLPRAAVADTGESQSEVMLRTARERKEKRMQEEEEEENARKAKARAKQLEIEEKMALRETIQTDQKAEDADRLMWRRSPLPPTDPTPNAISPKVVQQVLRPARSSQPSPTTSPQLAPQPPNMDAVYSNLFAGISAPVMPDENTMMGQPVPPMPEAVVTLEEMAPRAAATPRQLYDPKSDTFVEHQQRSDASESAPKTVSTNPVRKSKNTVRVGGSADVSTSQSATWKREGELTKPQDTRKKDEKDDVRKKREEDMKAGRARERASRPPRTQGKLYKYNTCGEIEDVDRPEEAKTRAEKKRIRLEEEKANRSDDKISSTCDENQKTDRKERKLKGKKGRMDVEKLSNEVNHAEKVVRNEDNEEVTPGPSKKVIPPPPPEAWALGKNPLVPTAPDSQDTPSPVSDAKPRRSRGSKAVGPTNKAKAIPTDPEIPTEAPGGPVFDDNEAELPFSTFGQFSGNDLWQGESSMAPLSLTFQRPSPFDISSSLSPGNATPSTWAVGGLAPIAKLSGGLYNFNISNFNGESPEDTPEWTNSSPPGENPLWETEVLGGLGSFDMEQPMQLSNSELNPAAPAVDSFGRVVDTRVAAQSTKQRPHKNSQRNKGHKNSRGPKEVKQDAVTTKEEGSDNRGGPRGRGKGKQWNKKNGPAASDAISTDTTPSLSKTTRSRGKGRGGHKVDSSKEETKKPPDGAAQSPGSSPRRRGKGGKK